MRAEHDKIRVSVGHLLSATNSIKGARTLRLDGRLRESWARGLFPLVVLAQKSNQLEVE